MVLIINHIMRHHCTLFFLAPVFYGVVARNKQVDHKESFNRCHSRGGLAPSSFFSPIPETVNYKFENIGLWKTYSDINGLTLNEGESAWVAGYALYSLLVHWQQCSVHEHAAQKINSYSNNNCLKTCGYDQTSTNLYIGVNSKYCACLNQTDIDVAKLIECDPDNSSILGVFRLITGEAFDDFSFQCDTTNGTRKCSEKHRTVCIGGEGYRCNGTNHTVNNRSYCLMKTRNSWRDSVRVCKDMDTRIVPYRRLISNLNEEAYWLGTFRSFTVVKDRVGNHSPCLVITRVGKELILEPEDCTELRLYLCFNDIKETSPNDYNDFVISIFATIGGCLSLLGLVCVILYMYTELIGYHLDMHKEDFHIHNGVESNIEDDVQLADIGGSYTTLDPMSFAQSRGQVQGNECSSISRSNRNGGEADAYEKGDFSSFS